MTPFTPILTVTDTPQAVLDALTAYEDVKRAYDRAVTLMQTQKIAEIWPALREAKFRLLEAELAA